MNSSILIKNGSIVLFDRIIVGNLYISNGIIHAIGNSAAPESDIEIDAGGKYILPGFIDIHTHGADGFDFTNGLFDQKTGSFIKDEAHFFQGLRQAANKYLAAGTTRVVLATVSAPQAELIQSFEFFENFLKQSAEQHRGHFEGIFLEGTFIKNKSFAGAQNPKFFQTPSIPFFQTLQDAAKGRIRSVNVTPEFGNDALKLIEYLSKNHVIVGAGHTGATADEYQAAIERGLRIAIHFLNGPTGGSTKPFGHGGAMQAVLRSKKVFAELITDGFHIDPIYVREVIRRKGLPRLIAITDSMFITGMHNIETFVVSGVLGRVSDNRRYLEVAGTQNALFGSVLTMDVAFSNIISWLTREMQGIWTEHHSALPFQEALIQATWMCSRNPAKALGIMRPETHYFNQDLSNFTGSLDVGKSADVLITSIDGTPGDYKLQVDKVIARGKLVE